MELHIAQRRREIVVNNESKIRQYKEEIASQDSHGVLCELRNEAMRYAGNNDYIKAVFTLGRLQLLLSKYFEPHDNVVTLEEAKNRIEWEDAMRGEEDG